MLNHYPPSIKEATRLVWTANHHMSLNEALFFVLNNRSVTQ